MWPTDALAERRIREAMEAGEFDDLEGAGRPLRLDDDTLVPQELRAVLRLLKNAGHVPQEVRVLKEIGDLEAWLRSSTDENERVRGRKRLALLRAALGDGRARWLEAGGYGERLRADLDRR
jgi:hypothetical protein